MPLERAHCSIEMAAHCSTGKLQAQAVGLVVRSNGCPWSEWTCAAAAKYGRLDVLQWARANGCPWDEWTCSEAAKGGRLDVLQWAHANGSC
jgi:hypothetical protein